VDNVPLFRHFALYESKLLLALFWRNVFWVFCKSLAGSYCSLWQAECRLVGWRGFS